MDTTPEVALACTFVGVSLLIHFMALSPLLLNAFPAIAVYLHYSKQQPQSGNDAVDPDENENEAQPDVQGENEPMPPAIAEKLRKAKELAEKLLLDFGDNGAAAAG
jgi:hypothetical protein